ncbi:MAG: hypothetical protein OHK0013_03290 [Sandaracinaceae bacterium]
MRLARSHVRSSFRLGRWVHGARELPSLFLASLWLAGVVGAPLVHLAQHARLAPHAHLEAGTLAHVAERAGTCHDDHCHEDEVSRDASDDEAPADHGRGSGLHGDVAALFPPPPFVIPPFVAIGLRAIAEVRDDVTDPAPASAPWARGPPRTF